MAAASGRRVPLFFGTKKIKRKGKEVTVNLIASVQESVITALSIKLKPASEQVKTDSLVEDSKKRKRLPSIGGTKSATRAIRASADGVTYYSIPIPQNMSFGAAEVEIKKQSKAIAFITPKGTKSVLGKLPASKAKSTTKKPARKR